MYVKICGIRNLPSARVCENLGADFLGFVFYPKSKRYIEPFEAGKIAKNLRRIKKVGVFVDEDADTVQKTARIAGLDYIQLHGNEDEVYAKAMPLPVIKAFRYQDGFLAKEANDFPAEIILIDSFKEGSFGGTGEAFSWQSAKKEIEKITKPVLIAGGVSMANVNDVWRTLNPYGVDVSGSLESGGEKDDSKISEFLKYVKKHEGELL